jgi:hypothetical protein
LLLHTPEETKAPQTTPVAATTKFMEAPQQCTVAYIQVAKYKDNASAYLLVALSQCCA